ncbi:MAG: hypothetical protein AAFZ06_11040 [Pseudomonadota bacterium]
MIWPDGLPLLKRGRVHEVISGDSTSGNGVTASVRAFAALQAVVQPTGARHERGRATPDDAVIWVSQPPRRRSRGASTRLDPYGLADFFDPGRLILLEARQPIDVFWAAEECLRSGAAPLVVAEPATVADLTASRRLQLAMRSGRRRAGPVALPSPSQWSHACERCGNPVALRGGAELERRPSRPCLGLALPEKQARPCRRLGASLEPPGVEG